MDDGHITARHVAWTDLDDQRRTLLDPVPTLGLGLDRLGIEQHAHRLPERRLCAQFACQRLAIVEHRRVAFVIAQHRHDHDLPRRDLRRAAQPIIIAMRHDDATNQPRRHAPTCCVAQRVTAILVLIADARRIGEAGAQIMRRARLQCLAVLHHRFDAVRRLGSRKTLMLWLFTGNDRHAQRIDRECPIHFQRAQRLRHRIGLVGVRGMSFLPQKFAGAQEHPRPHFPTHDIGPLIDLHR